MQPNDLQYAILFHKKNTKNLKFNFFAKYIGFFVPDVFLIGFGLDYNEKFREIAHLCKISQKGIETFKK